MKNVTDKEMKKNSKLEKKIVTLFQTIRKNEYEKLENEMSGLDKKIVTRLKKEGHADLAEKISKNTESKKSNKIFNWGFFKISLIFTGVLASLVLVGFVAMYTGIFDYLFGNKNKLELLSKLRQEVPVPQMSLRPEKYTSSGYVASENTFTINISEKVLTNINDAIEVSPEFEYSVEVRDNDDGEGSQIKIIPQEELAIGETYTIYLKEGTEFANNSKLSKPITWVMQVEPIFALTGITPVEGAEDVPVDSTIEFEFNHKNIDADSLKNYVTIFPEISGNFMKVGTKIVFVPDRLLSISTKYTVSVSKDFANSDGEALVSDSLIEFTTSSRSSTNTNSVCTIYNQTGNDTVTDNISFVLQSSFCNNATVQVEVYRVTEKDVISELIADMGRLEEIPANSNLEKSEVFTLSDRSGIYIYKPQSYGVYVVKSTMTEGSNSVYALYSYSPLSVINLNGNGESTGWVVNMGDSSGVADATVTTYKYENEGKIDETQTGSDGRYSLSAGDIVMAKKDSYTVIFVANVVSSIYGVSNNLYRSDYSAQTVLDKPMYLPGDTVNIKAMIRKISGVDIEIPNNMIATMIVYDSDVFDTYSNKKSLSYIYKEELPISESGSISTSFTIPYSAKNRLSVQIYIDKEVIYTGSISVGTYQKSQYNVTVAHDKDKYTLGEPINVSIVGKDYSGNPLANMSLRVKLYEREVPNIYSSKDEITYSSSYIPASYTLVSVTDITLDDTGKYDYTYSPIFAQGGTSVKTYTVEVQASDELRLAYDSVWVTKCDIDALINTDRYNYAEGANVTLDVETYKLWSLEKAPDKTVTISVTRDWYERYQTGTTYNEESKTFSNVYAYQRKTEVVSSNVSLTTNDKGLGQYVVNNVKPGYYSVEINYDGYKLISNKYAFDVYSTSGDETNTVYSDYLRVTLDKKVANEGDTVKAYVDTIYGMQGYIFVKGGKLFEWSKFDTNNSSSSTVFEFNVDTEKFPAVNVCAVGIADRQSSEVSNTSNFSSGKRFAIYCAYLNVSSDEGLLTVDIKTDKETYHPGEEVTATINVKDKNGDPVSGELLLWTVDQSLLDAVSYQNKANDYYRNMFYSTRTYRLNLVAATRDCNMFFGYGGSGGEGAPSRDTFKDVAIWNPSLITDTFGNAEYTFVLPDNLTTWNIGVVGTSGSDKFGEQHIKIQTQLDTFVNVTTPDFVRTGDTFGINVNLANYSTEKNIKIEVNCEGCVNENYNENKQLGANARQDNSYSFKTNKTSGQLKIESQIYECAQEDDCTKIDGVIRNIPVYTSSVIYNSTRDYLLEDGQDDMSIEADLGEEYSAEVNRIDMTISKGFDYNNFLLPADPYTTSTISLSNALLNNSFIYSNYEKLNPSVDKNELMRRVSTIADKIALNQQTNGGFGWFSYDAVSVESSVYAAESLIVAKANGVDVNSSVLTHLEEYLIGILDGDYSLFDKVLATKGLSYIDKQYAISIIPDVRKAVLENEETRKSPETIAYLMQAYNNLGSTGDSAELAPYLYDLREETDRTAFWKEPESNYKLSSTPEYTTAMVYLAISPLEEWNNKYKARNWLLERDFSSYSSDPVVQRVVYAIGVSDLGNMYDRSDSNTLDVYVNGKFEEKVTLPANDIYSKYSFTLYADSLQQGKNSISIKRVGSGDIHIATVVSRLIDTSSIFNTDEFIITKEYKSLSDGTAFQAGSDGVSLQKNTVYKVALTVTPKEDLYNVTVRDQFASGMNLISPYFQSLPTDIESKFWAWIPGQYVNRYGAMSTDNVSFDTVEMKAGQTYYFEYLMSPKFSGTYSGGEVTAEAFLLPEKSTLYFSKDIEVK